jgi:nitroreductase
MTGSVHDDDFAAFERTVRRRRSIRVFAAEPVPEAVMERALDLALLAPNSSNLQPWEFWWVRDPVKKARLVEACMSQAAARTAAELVVIVARTDTWERHRRAMVAHLDRLGAEGVAVPERVQQYYRYLTPKVYRCWFPWSLVKWVLYNTVALLRPGLREPIGRADMRVWAVKTTALAAENFMLALAAQGYDTCPMEGVDPVRIRRLLRLPRRAYVVMVVAVGRARPVDTARGAPLPQFRVPRDWVVHIVDGNAESSAPVQ